MFSYTSNYMNDEITLHHKDYSLQYNEHIRILWCIEIANIFPISVGLNKINVKYTWTHVKNITTQQTYLQLLSTIS